MDEQKREAAKTETIASPSSIRSSLFRSAKTTGITAALCRRIAATSRPRPSHGRALVGPRRTSTSSGSNRATRALAGVVIPSPPPSLVAADHWTGPRAALSGFVFEQRAATDLDIGCVFEPPTAETKVSSATGCRRIIVFVSRFAACSFPFHDRYNFVFLFPCQFDCCQLLLLLVIMLPVFVNI